MSEVLAVLLTIAGFFAGCGGPAIAPSPCPAPVHAAEPPPGTYIDQRATIDYDALVPLGDPRRDVDGAYARQVIAEPVLLEQIYYDATRGNQRAAWLVCELEETARESGRQVARYLASLRCQTIASCQAHWDELPLSRDTASGQRLLSVLATAFEQEAKKQQLASELIGNAMMVLAGAHIAARATVGVPRPSGMPSAGRGAPLPTARVSSAGGGNTARFITNSAGRTIDLRAFQGLTKNPGTVAVGRSGAGRPLTGPPKSYSLTDGGHALVYGPEGRLVYDVSASRIKVFQWSQAPNGQWFPRTGANLKFKDVPQSVLKTLELR